jgi:hypothetical protein
MSTGPSNSSQKPRFVERFAEPAIGALAANSHFVRTAVTRSDRGERQLTALHIGYAVTACKIRATELKANKVPQSCMSRTRLLARWNFLFCGER